jgi:prepilin-type N-terminal cleavage/methylation domain-containing protein
LLGMRYPRYAERGFSLVEVVIVLAILGIIGAVTAPALARVGRQDAVTNSAGEVVRVLRSARMAALERAAPVSVIIEPASGKYLVTTDADDSRLTLAEGTLALAPGVRLASYGPCPRLRFAFSRLGSAAADSMTVTGDGGSAVIKVDRWSGELRAD